MNGLGWYVQPSMTLSDRRRRAGSMLPRGGGGHGREHVSDDNRARAVSRRGYWRPQSTWAMLREPQLQPKGTPLPTEMPSSPGALRDRRVVVTGAGSGLGAAYAEAAAALGASVIVNDLDPGLAADTATRIRQTGGTASPFAADIADWDGARAAIEGCIDEFGGIDGLVNNAGIVGRLRPMTDETEKVARRVVDVNVLGTLFAGIHAARAMVQAGVAGAIVNVSSGNQCGHALLSTYGATKGAVSTLTYAWAADLAEHGIRVNAISPNAHTGQIDEVIEQLGYNPEDREYPQREDNAAVVCFLLSDASKELSGQIVRVDRGYVSVMTHPLVAAPRVPMSEWTVDALGAVFSSSLAGKLQPTGVALAEVGTPEVLH